MTAARDERPERPMVGEPDKKEFRAPPLLLYEHGAPLQLPLETQWLDDDPKAAVAWLPQDSFLCWHRVRTANGGKQATLLAISHKGHRYEIGLAA